MDALACTLDRSEFKIVSGPYKNKKEDESHEANISDIFITPEEYRAIWQAYFNKKD